MGAISLNSGIYELELRLIRCFHRDYSTHDNDHETDMVTRPTEQNTILFNYH